MSEAARVITPLEGVFALRSMLGRERLGEPYVYDLELFSEEHDVDLQSLLGQVMSVELRGTGDELRYFHGHVTEMARVGYHDRYALYRVRLEPWLKLMSYNVECRIFQRMKPAEVAKALVDEVFGDRAHPNFLVNDLAGEYHELDYAVQYHETDFAFFSRILEEAGIYYFFQHTPDQADLVLGDGRSAHPAGLVLEYVSTTGGSVPNKPHLSGWQRGCHLRPAVAGAKAYDYADPESDDPMTTESEILKAGGEDYQVFRYSGRCRTPVHGAALAARSIARDEAQSETIRVQTNARSLATGHTVKMMGHPLERENGTYVVLASDFHIEVSHKDFPGTGQPVFSAQLEVIPWSRRFLPQLNTPHPQIPGPQTAVVVGPQGEEIYTDSLGRVKLRFRWNASPTRKPGTNDAPEETHTCWVRVSQAWASAGFGAQFIPRVGDEVVVAFLEGDPDQPLVVGSVYNGNNAFPFPPQTNPTQSGIKTRSSLGGSASNFNEIRFEDKKGSEDLFLHAEKTQTTHVKGSQSITVGGSRTVTVKGEEVHTVTGKETRKFENGRSTEVLKGPDELVVAKNYSNTITGDYTVKQGGKNSFSMTGGSKIEIKHGGTSLVIEGTTLTAQNGSFALEMTTTQAELKGKGTESVKLSSDGVTVTGSVIKLNS